MSFSARIFRVFPPAPPHLEASVAVSSLVLRKATASFCNLLRRLYSKTACLFEFSMDLSLSSYAPTPYASIDEDLSAFDTSTTPPALGPLYLVPLSWWNDAATAMNAGRGEEIDGIIYDVTSSAGKRDFGADDWLCHKATEIVLEMRRGNVTETGASGDLHFALLSEGRFLKAFKWHNDMKDTGVSLLPAYSMPDLFSLKIHLSVLYKTNSLVIKINEKENTIRKFDRASGIFSVDTGMLQISDFSGKINQISIGDQNSDKEVEQPDKELNLELHVYGPVQARELKGEKLITGNYNKARALGLAGLHNLGNTCYMNSAVQCLVHTSDLVDYFLGDFRNNLNTSNPLGRNGKIALAFGDLLRKLWTPGKRLVYPSALKSVMCHFHEQFKGGGEHDAQEFATLLLQELNEDLRRVEVLTDAEVKDSDGRPDEEVADEHWRNHHLDTGSIIGDLFEGQCRSTLACPVCGNLSFKFEPFTCLSLPIPLKRAMVVTIISTDGVTLPYNVTIYVPKHGKMKDIIGALSTTCCLKEDETLLVAQVYEEHSIIGFLDELSASIDLIKDEDDIVAYRLAKESEGSSLVVFTHEREDKYLPPSLFPGRKFGFPLVSRISNLSEGSQIRQEFLKILQPFLLSMGNSSKVFNVDEDGDPSSKCERGSARSKDFQFYLGGGFVSERFCIKMDGPVPSSTNLQVLVSWSERMNGHYAFRVQQVSEHDQEIASLYECLDIFSEEESLEPEIPRHCSSCNVYSQASKKLDFWKLPEILFVQLKRFSFEGALSNKLETFVRFPTVDLDLSNYTAHHNQSQTSHTYSLYAVSNHYGSSTNSGHYSSYVQDKSNRWFEFSDDSVTPVGEECVVSAAAYLLFYRRNK